ncbi:MAG: hypothetical protein WBN56_12690 [Robiginitalea sp.]|uniref:hypothetical protein n=1 Tax=Robiginitalea sp. TaxID=1902411 RepID=UPI003C76F1C4
MENIWVIVIAILIFSVLSMLFYISMKGYVSEAFGKKWLTLWGNKVYFWQSLIFVSTAGTVVILYLLKWGNILAF